MTCDYVHPHARKTKCEAESELMFKATAELNEQILNELKVPDPDEDTARNDRGVRLTSNRESGPPVSS